MKKIIIHTFIFILILPISFAQSADEEFYTPADTSKKILSIKTSTTIPESSVFMDDEEPEEQQNEIAALYGDFDNNVIHQYKYKEIFQTRDSLTISFNQEKFTLPVCGKINSHYGWRKYRPHYGTDLHLAKGDSVKSAFDGIVRYANKKVKGYGQVIIIRHYNGLETVYAHLSKILVEPNDTIKSGDIIGLGGSTGRSTGPHLHFEIRCLGVPINTEDIIDYENACLKKNEFILSKKDAEETYNLRSKKYISNKSRNFYIVKKGDTLSKISKKTGVSISSLMKKNKLKSNSILKPGRKLNL